MFRRVRSEARADRRLLEAEDDHDGERLARQRMLTVQLIRQQVAQLASRVGILGKTDDEAVAPVGLQLRDRRGEPPGLSVLGGSREREADHDG